MGVGQCPTQLHSTLRYVFNQDLSRHNRVNCEGEEEGGGEDERDRGGEEGE